MIPTEPEELDALAGEYVLGTLDAEAAAEVAAALEANAALRRAVISWEERLHPLADLAPPADPPLDLWDRIAANLPSAGAARQGPALRRALALWRANAIAATAIAASLLAYVLLRPAPSGPPAWVALLHAPTAPAPVWLATAGNGALRLDPIAAYPAPPGRDLELWVIPAGSKVPRPLGLIPAGGRFVGAQPPALGSGAVLAISIEPKGGSPTGLPTGPVVLIGDVRGT